MRDAARLRALDRVGERACVGHDDVRAGFEQLVDAGRVHRERAARWLRRGEVVEPSLVSRPRAAFSAAAGWRSACSSRRAPS